MAYYSGTANDMTAVRSALVAACTSEGWTWNAGEEVLHKDTMFVRLQLSGEYLRLLGRTGLTTGDAPHVVQMGPFTGYSGTPLPALDWPVGYELFVFEAEVYCIINYNVDVYQWCAFGQSTVDNLPGSGMWLGASGNKAATGYSYGISISPAGGGSSYSTNVFCPALFWRSGGGTAAGHATESLVYSDLDTHGWWWGTTYNCSNIGVDALKPLVNILPNDWNSEAILLPIRAYKARFENRISLIADLDHARYTRLDHYTPGQVITIGSDRWKIFPWYRKNITGRDGFSWRGNHTGTLGWAIRYEGP